MYPMDKFSAIMWLNTMKAAQNGNQYEIENLEAENQMRQSEGYPTVEEEMKMILNDKYPNPSK